MHTPAPTTLRTERLLLRQWCDGDREPFAELNRDPLVMEHFPAPLSREESHDRVDRYSALLAARGWGFWAVEVVASGEFAGFVGLNEVAFEAGFTPAVEIGWRLARSQWGKGFAPEAAAAALAYGFQELQLPEVVSFTAVANTRSERVMQKLDMRHDPAEDFDHPLIDPGSPVRRHVLYRLTAATWRARSRPPRN